MPMIFHNRADGMPMIFHNSISVAESVIDSYSEANSTAGAAVGYYISGQGWDIDYGQSFKPTQNAILTRAKFYLSKGGAGSIPGGSVRANLYPHTGTYGSGGKPADGSSVLALSNAVSYSDLPPVNTPALVEFTFSSSQQYNLQANTPYVLTVSINWMGEQNSWLNYYFDYTAPYGHSGNQCRQFYWNISSVYNWYAQTYDGVFYAYADATTDYPMVFSGAS